MDLSLHSYLIICFGVFIAGFVDSIAGGGGLISVPSYLAAGLPAHIALGNNKFSSVFGTILSTTRYLKHGLIDIKTALTAAILALIGSFFGAKTVLLLDPSFLAYILMVLIPLMAVFTLLKKEMGIECKRHLITFSNKTTLLLCALAGFVIGFYDGFFGPGTGAFLIMFFTLVLGFDFAKANANTKLINLASNLAAVITFIVNGNINYNIGIIAVFFGMTGNWLGSHIAIKKGAKFIRPVFIIVLLLLFAKLVYSNLIT